MDAKISKGSISPSCVGELFYEIANDVLLLCSLTEILNFRM